MSAVIVNSLLAKTTRLFSVDNLSSAKPLVVIIRFLTQRATPFPCDEEALPEDPALS
jgi:hypothetical protein